MCVLYEGMEATEFVSLQACISGVCVCVCARLEEVNEHLMFDALH